MPRNPINKHRSFTAKSLISRRYKSDLRRFKEILRDNHINVLDETSAASWMICVMSDSDYDIGEKKSNVSEGKRLFVDPDNYETATELKELL